MKTLPGQRDTNLGLFVNPIRPDQKANVERWIADLESGLYEQTRAARMKYQGRYCCLGILHRITLGSTERTPDEVLTANSKNACGLSSVSGHMTQVEDENNNKLSILNDSEDWDFKDISQLLRDQLSLTPVATEAP